VQRQRRHDHHAAGDELTRHCLEPRGRHPLPLQFERGPAAEKIIVRLEEPPRVVRRGLGNAAQVLDARHAGLGGLRGRRPAQVRRHRHTACGGFRRDDRDQCRLQPRVDLDDLRAASIWARTAARASPTVPTCVAFFQKLPGPSMSGPEVRMRGRADESSLAIGKITAASLCRSRTVVTPYLRNTAGVQGSTCTCASMSPGSSSGRRRRRRGWPGVRRRPPALRGWFDVGDGRAAHDHRRARRYASVAVNDADVADEQVCGSLRHDERASGQHQERRATDGRFQNPFSRGARPANAGPETVLGRRMRRPAQPSYAWMAR